MKNNHVASGKNVWTSFVIGLLVGSGGLYLLGTNQGRKFLRGLLDAIDDIELTAEDILSEVEEILAAVVQDESTPIAAVPKMSGESLESVLHKIQHALPIRKNIKKYFSKEGQIQK